MASGKFKPGIPDNFSFDVAPVNDLGDYLDEPRPAPPPVRRAPVSAPAPEPRATPTVPARIAVAVPDAMPVVKTPEQSLPLNTDTPRPLVQPPVVSRPVQADAPPGKPRAPRHTGPRREINMTPDTLRMSDELLELIQSGSGQRDTKSSELFHALVLLVFEVKDELDLHVIPKRGRWGSPTARAYPLELKNAFRQALRKGTAD